MTLGFDLYFDPNIRLAERLHKKIMRLQSKI